jgi:type IV pili sensor histidine kinase/response regulator
MFFPSKRLLLSSVLLMASMTTYAEGFTHSNSTSLQLSRYSIQLTGATKAQKDPLQAVIKHLRFSSKVKMVGVAIVAVLKNSGYRVSYKQLEPKTKELFRLPLPSIQRNMGPLRVEQALTTLAGEPWMLVVDREHRLVSFQLPETCKPKAATKTSKSTDIDTFFDSLSWDND